jgi:hypothetical protein
VNRSNTIATRKTISLFLAFMLIAGTITAFYPSSSFMTEVHAALSADYETMLMMNDDNNNYKLKYLPYKKEDINCNNFNLNGNGLNINKIPESLRSLLASQTQEDLQGEVEGTDSKTNIFDNGEKRFGYGYDNNDFVYKCINNNDNEQSTPPISPPPPPSIDNNVYVVWDDNTLGNREIFFAVSTDNGQTFSLPENISNTPGESIQPQFSTEGNNVYVIWMDNTTTFGEYDIFFAVSTDNGQTFSTPINLSNNVGFSVDPQISTEGNNVYVVWGDNTAGSSINSDIFFAESNDNGQTFSLPENISNNPISSFNPQISIEVNNVYVVWTDIDPLGDTDIFFAVSTDNGQTFSLPENISNNAGESVDPQISTEGNNVYVVWTDTPIGNGDIFFAVSTDNGQTFSLPENISNNAGGSFAPQISTEGNNVYVVWEDFTLGNPDIFFAESNDNGQIFSLPEIISNNAGGSSASQISTEGNNVYVVWRDLTPGPRNPDIFFAESNDNGQIFSLPENISNNAGFSENPQISSSIISQENPNSEIQMTNPEIQMINPTQQTVSVAFQQQPEDSPIIAQGTGDLSALEKIEKLKKQWLELLP